MHEIDFWMGVELVGIDQGEFMEYVDEKLYEKYQGNVSPAICNGEPIVQGTVEATGPDRWLEAVLPIVKELAALGVRARTVEKTHEMALA